MPQATSMAVRQTIIDHYKSGKSVSWIARTLKKSRTTIYQLIERHEIAGDVGLRPNYQNCGKQRLDSTDFIYRAVRCFRTWHPTWGSEKIHAEMQMLRPELALPHYRTFNRWFHWNGQLDQPLKTSLPKVKGKRATNLHEGWQVDAKEEMVTKDGVRQCWLNITDEFSGTVISPPVFSLQENL